ncbi:hypothetical protein A5784_14270 [Mycobacterium sp. 852013-50091_SCH5140682]|nr:hypothetical protein A5784_14270 [Mycobacterium sp. 852013-50091_SCH5140682]
MTGLRVIAMPAVITALALLAGCSQPAQQPAATTVTVTTERGPEQPPVAPTGEPRRDASGAMLKAIGEGAGVGCPSPTAPCDLEFTVTAIEPGYQCSDPYQISPLAPGQQYLRYSVDGQAANKLEWSGSADALRINNWAIEDGDGVLHRDLDIASPCTEHADAVLQTFVPGTRMRGTVTVIAPASAKELRLIVGDMSWVWPIPPKT